MITKNKDYQGRILGYISTKEKKVIVTQKKQGCFDVTLNNQFTMRDIPFDKYTPMEAALFMLLGIAYPQDKSELVEYEKDLVRKAEPNEYIFTDPAYYKVNI